MACNRPGWVNGSVVTADMFNNLLGDMSMTIPGTYDINPNYKGKAEEQSICAYCGAEYHFSKFHPGNCGECGGPRGNANNNLIEVTAYGDNEPVFIVGESRLDNSKYLY